MENNLLPVVTIEIRVQGPRTTFDMLTWLTGKLLNVLFSDWAVGLCNWQEASAIFTDPVSQGLSYLAILHVVDKVVLDKSFPLNIAFENYAS